MTLDNYLAEMRATVSQAHEAWGLGKWDAEPGREERQINEMEVKIDEQEAVCPLLKRCDGITDRNAERHYRQLRYLLRTFRILLRSHYAMHPVPVKDEPNLCLS
jgi:hypothetical protein